MGWVCQQCSHNRHPSKLCDGTCGHGVQYYEQMIESREKWRALVEERDRKMKGWM